MINYTDRQKEAIRSIDGDVEILACAGSGKTQVISQRIVNILKEKQSDGICPENIVAFTFTRKAAAEMKGRIHTLCQEQMGSTQGLAAMYIGTIHGFCLDLLQNYEPKYLKYSVLSDIQQDLFIDRYGAELPLLKSSDGRILKPGENPELYKKLFTILREAQIDLELLENHPALDALQKYQRRLDKQCCMDFSMLLTEAAGCLENDQALRSRISSKIKYLVVDEYQDINPVQERVIRQLHDLGAHLCVVGDDDQTIFQWNGSDIENILRFTMRYEGTAVLSMGDNFRSSPGIVDTARFLAGKHGGRIRKEMVSRNVQQFEPGDILGLKFSDQDEEARWIVQKIQALRGIPFNDKGNIRGLSYSDCAILFRSAKKSADPVMAALKEAGIPYIIKDACKLFDNAEIQAARGIFLYLCKQLSAQDLRLLWEKANLGLKPADIDNATSWLDDEKKRWPGLDKRSEKSIQHIYQGFLSALCLTEDAIPLDGCKTIPRNQAVYYNLGRFSKVITDFESINFDLDMMELFKDFITFLDTRATDNYPEGWEDSDYIRPDSIWPDAVQIMTIHKSKGLEFPAVFIPNLLDGRFPLNQWRWESGKEWYNIIPEKAVIGGQRFKGSMGEERRLFYVAVTRSKKYLYCTWAPEDDSYHIVPSEFMSDILSAGRAITKDPGILPRERLEPRPSRDHADMVLSFSKLKYLYKCPYGFKMRFLYGFNPGFSERLGYGRSLHNALAEIHSRLQSGDGLEDMDVEALLDTHFHIPYVMDDMYGDMRNRAGEILKDYIKANDSLTGKIDFTEKAVEIKLGEGIVVSGRIDLLRRTDSGEDVIVDFKADDWVQDELTTMEQLNLYALGYLQLAGKPADIIEIYNLKNGARTQFSIDEELLATTHKKALDACHLLKDGSLCRSGDCESCDFNGICRGLE